MIVKRRIFLNDYSFVSADHDHQKIQMSELIIDPKRFISGKKS